MTIPSPYKYTLNTRPCTLNPGSALVTLKSFGQELRLWSIETTLPYQPNRAAFLRFLLGHDFLIGKARLWLAERAKYRGSHGKALETGFKRSTTPCVI
jgi:hypothetical protein